MLHSKNVAVVLVEFGSVWGAVAQWFQNQFSPSRAVLLTKIFKSLLLFLVNPRTKRNMIKKNFKYFNITLK